MVGLFDRQNPLLSAGVADIKTGYLLVSLRGDRMGRATMGWIATYLSTRLGGTGAAIRLLPRKPFLSPRRDVTLETMESHPEALRLIVDQLSASPLYQPGS